MQMQEGHKIFFTSEALARFVSAQDLIVEKIVCHLWQNTIDANNTVELIDNVELHFNGDKKLTISCNEAGDGLDVIDFDYRKTARALHTEYDGRIKLFAVDASTTKMWESVIGKVLKKVRVTRDDGNYLADSIVLDFGEELREISIAPLDGLIIDYYEED
jgi:hypothetical protein